MKSDESATAIVSVLIATYDMARYLPAAVTSVLDGQFDEVEVVVIDDGSRDGTPAVMQQFTDPAGARYDPRVRYLRKRNGGKPSALNLGLRAARGAFVTILDADDELGPTSLSDRWAALRPGAEVVIGGFEVIDEQGASLGRRPAPSFASVRALRKQFWTRFKTPFSLNACLVARELIERVAPFDRRLPRCQDIDYSLRLLAQADSVVCTDAIVYRYRKHRSSVRQRMGYRLRTMRSRPLVFWKNFRGLERVLAVVSGVALDLGKGAYEMVSNYEG